MRASVVGRQSPYSLPLQLRAPRRTIVNPLSRCLALVLLSPCCAAIAADPGSQSRFRDPQDGWLDLSEFLDTAYGFVPVVSPITEPAVGYGAAAALVFIDRDPVVEGDRPAWPDIAALGGLATGNGTDGLFAGHLGNWRQGSLRSQLAIADADVNLTFYGLGEDARPGGKGLDYTVSATGGLAGGNWRIDDRHWWVGLRYGIASTQVTSRADRGRLPGLLPEDRDLNLAALTPSVTYDSRDNFFTPTQGSYIDLSVPVFRGSFGSNRDFETAALTVMHYRPLGERLFLGVRGGLRTSSDGTPFFLRPYILLRGVPAMRYQGEQAVDAEAELRWQFHPRFSAVGFAGTGGTRTRLGGHDASDHVTAGGAGFRYLLARTYGLQMGLDLAFGPDDPVLYVIFGSAWLRP